jgi:hypothetical protein
VRPTEIGSTKYIKQHARAADSNLLEFELEVQFRCGGSAGFVNWVDNTLGIERTANVLWTGAAAFDFKILPTPAAVEKAIRAKVADGITGRIAAGFCWKWSTDPDESGALVNDIVIDDWRKPWNARPDSVGLAEGIPRASLWATEPGGLEQVGCIYTAQGFEFDYIGVIWGKDLVYDLDQQTWVGNSKESCDGEVKRSGDAFLDLVKNTYRVLLTRGMKGCYVCFLDQSTERFVRSRIHLAASDSSYATLQVSYPDHSPAARPALKGPPQPTAQEKAPRCPKTLNARRWAVHPRGIPCCRRVCPTAPTADRAGDLVWTRKRVVGRASRLNLPQISLERSIIYIKQWEAPRRIAEGIRRAE